MARTLQMAALPRSEARQVPAAATLAALGIVYGDIGTSPLYGFKQAADAARTISPATIIGIVSVIPAHLGRGRGPDRCTDRRPGPGRAGSGGTLPPHDLPGRSPSAGVKFAMDSLLEGDGFEPSVPRSRKGDSALTKTEAGRSRG